MTNAVITWIETKLGTLKTEVVSIEPSVLAWAKAFLSDITPVLKQAATDAVLAAATQPGTGQEKFAIAVATATKDLVTQGVPVVDNDVKAAVQIAYKALPQAVQSNSAAQAVEGAVDSQIDAAAAKVEATQGA